MSHDLAIAVVPRDRFSIFPQCLEALFSHTRASFHVIVAAGGADKATEAYLHQLRARKRNVSLVLAEHPLTQAEARNLAIQQAAERFCVVLENDTIVHDNWLEPMFECLFEERAAVVAPLILWYRGIHAAGCLFEQDETAGGRPELRHKILYTGIRRRRVDYPESHCILMDRKILPRADIFDDVEPFDVDFGLTLRKHGLSVFLEPRAVVTYSAPPPWEVRDIPLFELRWDPASWETRNERFMQKWGVTYNPSRKRASYRRQQIKLALARWFPSKIAIRMSNIWVGALNRLLPLLLMRGRFHAS